LRASSIRPYLVLMFAGVLPVLILFAAAYYLASNSVKERVTEANHAKAALVAAIAARELNQWKDTIQAHAKFPALSAAVERQDVDEVRTRLEIIVNQHPRLIRGFVTDLDGNLWSDYPIAQESLGRNFSDRDWYRGVTRDFKPYVSEVYQRNAEPAIHVVAIAVPVIQPSTTEPVGLMVVQLDLNAIATQFPSDDMGEDAHVLLVDHNGNLAAHSHMGVRNDLHDTYANTKAVQAALQGDTTPLTYRDPHTNTDMLAAMRLVEVGGNNWVVVAQQSTDTAFAPIRLMLAQILSVAVLVLLVVTILMAGLARIGNRLQSVNAELQSEVEQRKQAEVALQEANKLLQKDYEAKATELHATEQQLLHSQKLEAVGRLAGGIAHDFNNMLSVIIGYSELALQTLPQDSRHRAQFKQIHDAGVRAAELTRQLLAFSRKQVMQPKMINLNDILRRMHDMLLRLIGEDVDLVCKTADNLDYVEFDPSQVEQIVMNLAINARDAMPKGGKLTIETKNVMLDADYVARHADSKVGPHVMLAVSDNGEGMTAETREKIFEPFYTTKEAGRGTGLGLSTVYGIVKQGGGNIWVYSEFGRGTTLKVYLPRAEKADLADDEDESEVDMTETSVGTVLVIEDEPDVRALIVEILDSSGFTVLEAEDGESAKKALTDHASPIDLLLTDVVLPGKRGPEIAIELSELQPGLKVLYMSGYTDNAIVHHGVLDAGVSFLGKPIRPKELLAKVREVMKSPPPNKDAT
jgi:signal transduction histidine kinase/ActR/RegA family two-component response regulator